MTIGYASRYSPWRFIFCVRSICYSRRGMKSVRKGAGCDPPFSHMPYGNWVFSNSCRRSPRSKEKTKMKEKFWYHAPYDEIWVTDIPCEHCCVCSKNCCHTGPLQVCAVHYQTWPTFERKDPIAAGWQCPLCKTVYSPSVGSCICNKNRSGCT